MGRQCVLLAMVGMLAFTANLLSAPQAQRGETPPANQPKTTDESGRHMHKSKTETAGSADRSAEGQGSLTAQLVNPEKEAREKAATVQVKVTGVKIVDPELTHGQSRKGEGHIHYRFDDGPVIATTASKLSFHELSSGKHKIAVMLAGNDHRPLGPRETLNVNIP